MTLFPHGVEPQTESLTVIQGLTFRANITLFEDKEHLTRLNLSDVTVKLHIEGYLTLESGSGLTVNDTNGEIAVVLTPSQTEGAPPAPSSALHYYVTLEESPTEIVCPLKGQMTFTNP